MSKQVKCPRCGSGKTARFLYGLPVFTPELEADLKSKRVLLGGCCITDNDPKYYCFSCERGFGRMTFPQEIRREGNK